MSRKWIVRLLAAGVVFMCAGLFGFYEYAGWYGFNVVLRRGGSIWVTVTPDDARVSASMRLAFLPQPPLAQPGSFAWTARAPGFETGELSAIAEGREVDRFLLARIDPARFRFQVLNRAAGDRDLDGWMQGLGASLVVNGSYFGMDGTPDTPTVSDGVMLGPRVYQASHGAFVTSDAFSGIRDLQSQDWREVLHGARFGVVSYPMLVRPGDAKVKGDGRWLANRSFIGQDSTGHIVIGTSKDAFFSLERLAMFLREAPLGLVLALNLDGGPVACQGISIGGYVRDFCGDWETRTENGEIKLLRHLVGSRRWGLPNVLAVIPK
jgi:hypothetical protein